QLELALLNLVRNAADAMRDGGQISIRTSASASGLSGQPSVEVSVSDNGTGMPREVVQRASDPFFTTKKPGHGTGLGLWMVQRFVRACKGKLEIETAVGQGTNIRLLFPRTLRRAGAAALNRAPPGPAPVSAAPGPGKGLRSGTLCNRSR